MRAIYVIFVVMGISKGAAFAQSFDTDSSAITQQAEALFEPSRDLLDIKLAVDGIVDPSQNTAAVKSLVDRMAADVTAMAGKDADSAGRLAALKQYLYESGSWNDNKPFQYDLDDPLGVKPASRLLQRYLTTRRGNCITMPMLMMFIGERVGLKMVLAEAPLHVFIKYTDEEGKTWNLEATSGGGFTRDVWYRQKLPMSDAAVANGVYLRSLAHDEAATLIAAMLVEKDLQTGEYERAIAVSNVLLEHYPKFAYLLAKRGSAYGSLLHRELAGKYRRIQDIPPALKTKADVWYRLNTESFSQAESLGWRAQDGQTQ